MGLEGIGGGNMKKVAHTEELANQDFSKFMKGVNEDTTLGVALESEEGHQYALEAENLVKRAEAFLANNDIGNPTSVEEDLSYQISRLREMQNIVPAIISDDEKVAVGHTVAKLVAMKEKIVATIN
jgi:hypothetical protein